MDDFNRGLHSAGSIDKKKIFQDLYPLKLTGINAHKKKQRQMVLLLLKHLKLWKPY
jgi:hypothetical protein